MAQNRTSFRRILTRCLAVTVMLCMYGFSIIGGSALLLGASSTSALAHGSGHGGGFGGHGFGGHGFGGHGFGGGFHHGGFRGAGFGLGLGLYPYGYYGGYYPYYEDEGVCYVVRQRVKTRHGWRIRRVSVCE
jgi:hypothetical protein